MGNTLKRKSEKIVKDREPGVIYGVAKSRTQLRDWTATTEKPQGPMVKGRPLPMDGNYGRFGAVLLCICFSFYHSDCSFENGFQEKVEAGEHLGNCCKDLGENLPTATYGGGEKYRCWVYLWNRANGISDRLDVVMRERKKSRYVQSFWPEQMNRWRFHLKDKNSFVYYFFSMY